jgi:hypothetical protein
MGDPLHNFPLNNLVFVTLGTKAIMQYDITAAAYEALEHLMSSCGGLSSSTFHWVTLRAWRGKTWWSGEAIVRAFFNLRRDLRH